MLNFPIRNPVVGWEGSWGAGAVPGAGRPPYLPDIPTAVSTAGRRAHRPLVRVHQMTLHYGSVGIAPSPGDLGTMALGRLEQLVTLLPANECFQTGMVAGTTTRLRLCHRCSNVSFHWVALGLSRLFCPTRGHPAGCPRAGEGRRGPQLPCWLRFGPLRCRAFSSQGWDSTRLFCCTSCSLQCSDCTGASLSYSRSQKSGSGVGRRTRSRQSQGDTGAGVNLQP